MPSKPSGEIKTKIVHQTQKNGDIYVLERKTIENRQPIAFTKHPEIFRMWSLLQMQSSNCQPLG